MKAQKKFSNKKTMILVTIISLFMVYACGNKTEKSEEKNQTVTAPREDIHTATFLGNLEVLEQHVLAGSDLNKKNEFGSTPLAIAATFGKTEVAKLLIFSGADINLLSDDGSTPLHTAAFFCRTDIVKALLDKGVDKNVRNAFGATPLETVLAPFASVQPIYDQIGKDLGPFGMKLDYEFLQKTRPEIAALLK